MEKITIKVTKEQKELWMKHQKLEEEPNLSSFIRLCVNNYIENKILAETAEIFLSSEDIISNVIKNTIKEIIVEIKEKEII